MKEPCSERSRAFGVEASAGVPLRFMSSAWPACGPSMPCRLGVTCLLRHRLSFGCHVCCNCRSCNCGSVLDVIYDLAAPHAAVLIAHQPAQKRITAVRAFNLLHKRILQDGVMKKGPGCPRALPPNADHPVGRLAGRLAGRRPVRLAAADRACSGRRPAAARACSDSRLAAAADPVALAALAGSAGS